MDEKKNPLDQSGIPDDEIGGQSPKPTDEKNQDQGKLQPGFDPQAHERGTKSGDKQMPE